LLFVKKIPRWKSEVVNWRTDIAMPKSKRAKDQAMIYKTLHIKLNIEHRESHERYGMLRKGKQMIMMMMMMMMMIAMTMMMIVMMMMMMMVVVEASNNENDQNDDADDHDEDVHFVLDQHAELDL